MEKKYICFSAALLVFFMYGLVHPQTERGKISIGLDVGAQRIFGDKKEKEGFGFGGEGFVTYKILPFADVGLNIGFGQLNYEFLFPAIGPVPATTFKATTNLINVDLKSNLEVVSKGSFRPYLTLGAGIANFGIEDSGLDRKNVASFFGGGGVRYTVNPMVNLFLGGDYRFLDTDGLDGVAAGKAKDGYLNIRTGLSYQVGNKEEIPDIIAEERAPFVEVEDTSNDYEPQQKAPTTSGATGNETKDMEEYVRLKSKIDQLSGNVDSKEKEISELQRRLNDQKQRVSTMANKASTKPSVDLQKSSSMSSFSDIYEEALTHFYNKNYSEAISLFELLLQQYPRHSLASNCQYWIGQSLFEMNRYKEAITEFYKVLNFNRSLKKDDALFLLGKSYLKTGSGDRAKESFTRLLQDYPQSEFANEAKNYVAKL